MRRSLALFASLLLLASLPAFAAAPASAPAAANSKAPAKYKNVTLHIFSRVFGNFHDKVIAVPGKTFRVGDTDYTARVVRFEPDFTLDVKTRKVTSVSGDPLNPAFQIIVSKAGVVHDTSWAFFNMPPHFSAKAHLAFVATRIEFTNRPTLVSQDSLALRIQQREGAAH